MQIRALVRYVVVLCALTALLPAGAAVVYVNKNASGAVHDGKSWSTAFTTVQAGVNATVSGDEVWVAASTPAAPAYVETVTLASGVALYGGFAGTETQRNQRQWKTNVTILDGSNNAVVVLSAPGTVLDGFTVQNGNSGVGGVDSGTAIVSNCNISGNSYGVYVAYGTATLTDCTISGNQQNGIFVHSGRATVSNCSISRNSLEGVYVSYGTATMSHCTISENYYGVYAAYSTAKISVTDCTVSGNHQNGIFVYSGRATVSNCTIRGNYYYGVYVTYGTTSVSNCAISGSSLYGVFAYNGTATVSNCTISRNNRGVNLGYGTATVTNCVVTFNEVAVERYIPGKSVVLSHNDVYGNPAANYSHITDPTGTDGNISVDPLFNDRIGSDFHLRPASPCINAGDDSVLTAGETDLDGRVRKIGAHVDIGAYEAPIAARISDAIRALSIAAGLAVSQPGELAGLDVAGGDSQGKVDMLDIVMLLRQANSLT